MWFFIRLQKPFIYKATLDIVPTKIFSRLGLTEAYGSYYYNESAPINTYSMKVVGLIMMDR